MKKLYEGLALAYFVIATLAIMALAFLLVVSALWNVIVAAPSGDVVDPVLEGVGLLIIGFAIVETGKFIAEEEILRRRELRSPVESRRSLTKFVTIIVIAASLEALVMVFKTSRANIPDAIYPAALFIAAMAALVSLGGYQWLSSRINPEIPPSDPYFQKPDDDREAAAGSDRER